MPGIPRQWLDAIFYLYPSEKAALSSQRVGGSGFLMSMDPSPAWGLPPAYGHLYAVTNQHNIDGGFTVLRVNTQAGQVDTLPLERKHWFPHPDNDDIAVAPIGLNQTIFRFTFIPWEMAVAPDLFETEDLSIGDEAFLLGRFVDRDGKTSNTPVLRFGSIAQVDGDPVFQKERGHYQDSILVEVRSLSGFSGSPVFAYRGARVGPGKDDPNEAVIIPQVGTRVYLLGVNWGSQPWTAPVKDEITDKDVNPSQYVRTPSGMAFVVPIWKLAAVLADPFLVQAREAWEAMCMKEREQEQSGVVLDATKIEPSEYGRDQFMVDLDRVTRQKPDEPVPEG